jgi:hypothetical protein
MSLPGSSAQPSHDEDLFRTLNADESLWKDENFISVTHSIIVVIEYIAMADRWFSLTLLCGRRCSLESANACRRPANRQSRRILSGTDHFRLASTDQHRALTSRNPVRKSHSLPSSLTPHEPSVPESVHDSARSAAEYANSRGATGLLSKVKTSASYFTCDERRKLRAGAAGWLLDHSIQEGALLVWCDARYLACMADDISLRNWTSH